MNLNIAALLEAAEYLERRERGKRHLSISLSYFFLLLFLTSSYLSPFILFLFQIFT